MVRRLLSRQRVCGASGVADERLIAERFTRRRAAIYFKLYLIKDGRCVGKAKTHLAPGDTLDPLFQQVVRFTNNLHKSCVLHVSFKLASRRNDVVDCVQA